VSKGLAGDYKAPCGCEIHVIRWSSSRNVVSQKSCALHKAAPELLQACQHSLNLLSGLSTDGEITMTPEGKDAITAQLRAVITKATT
jgi:hypothetical protein